MAKIKIFNEILEISEKRENFYKLSTHYSELATKYTKEWAPTLSRAKKLNEITSKGDYYLSLFCEDILEQLSAYGVYTISMESLKNNYLPDYCSPYSDAIDNIDDLINEIDSDTISELHNAESQRNSIKRQRQISNNARTSTVMRFGGLGWALKDALVDEIQYSLKSSSIESDSSIIARGKSRQSTVFSKENLSPILDGLFETILCGIDIICAILKEENIDEIDSVSESDDDKCGAILNSIKSGRVPEDKIKSQILNALKLNIHNKDLSIYLYNNFIEEIENIDKIISIAGINPSVIKADIFKDYVAKKPVKGKSPDELASLYVELQKKAETMSVALEDVLDKKYLQALIQGETDLRTHDGIIYESVAQMEASKKDIKRLSSEMKKYDFSDDQSYNSYISFLENYSFASDELKAVFVPKYVDEVRTRALQIKEIESLAINIDSLSKKQLSELSKKLKNYPQDITTDINKKIDAARKKLNNEEAAARKALLDKAHNECAGIDQMSISELKQLKDKLTTNYHRDIYSSLVEDIDARIDAKKSEEFKNFIKKLGNSDSLSQIRKIESSFKFSQRVKDDMNEYIYYSYGVDGLFGTGKYGVVFNEKGIYCISPDAKDMYCDGICFTKYDDLKECTIETRSGNVIARINNRYHYLAYEGDNGPLDLITLKSAIELIAGQVGNPEYADRSFEFLGRRFREEKKKIEDREKERAAEAARIEEEIKRKREEAEKKKADEIARIEAEKRKKREEAEKKKADERAKREEELKRQKVAEEKRKDAERRAKIEAEILEMMKEEDILEIESESKLTLQTQSDSLLNEAANMAPLSSSSIGINLSNLLPFVEQECIKVKAKYPDLFDVSPKLVKHFGIPETATIYLGHDDTIFHSGKEGFVIASSGIYLRESFSKVVHFDYSDIIGTFIDYYAPESHFNVCSNHRKLTLLTGNKSAQAEIKDLLQKIAGFREE